MTRSDVTYGDVCMISLIYRRSRAADFYAVSCVLADEVEDPALPRWQAYPRWRDGLSRCFEASLPPARRSLDRRQARLRYPIVRIQYVVVEESDAR